MWFDRFPELVHKRLRERFAGFDAAEQVLGTDTGEGLEDLGGEGFGGSFLVLIQDARRLRVEPLRERDNVTLSVAGYGVGGFDLGWILHH